MPGGAEKRASGGNEETASWRHVGDQPGTNLRACFDSSPSLRSLLPLLPFPRGSLESVLSKTVPGDRRFGLLTGCDHPFCLRCIRSWRQKMDTGADIDTVRRCGWDGGWGGGEGGYWGAMPVRQALCITRCCWCTQGGHPQRHVCAARRGPVLWASCHPGLADVPCTQPSMPQLLHASARACRRHARLGARTRAPARVMQLVLPCPGMPPAAACCPAAENAPPRCLPLSAPNQALRTCPVCRTASHYIVPSMVWPSDHEEKERIVAGKRRPRLRGRVGVPHLKSFGSKLSKGGACGSASCWNVAMAVACPWLAASPMLAVFKTVLTHSSVPSLCRLQGQAGLHRWVHSRACPVALRPSLPMRPAACC